MSYPRGGFIGVRGVVSAGASNRDEARLSWGRFVIGRFVFGERGACAPRVRQVCVRVTLGGLTPRSPIRRPIANRPHEKRSPQSRGDLVHQGLFVGERARLELRIEQIAVGGQLETAAPGGDELQVPDLLLERHKQLGRQTDGLRLVASHRAVLQLQVHRTSTRFRRPVALLQ